MLSKRRSTSAIPKPIRWGSSITPFMGSGWDDESLGKVGHFFWHLGVNLSPTTCTKLYVAPTSGSGRDFRGGQSVIELGGIHDLARSVATAGGNGGGKSE